MDVPLFCIAMPRSRSTLLLRILQTGDGVAFGGETNCKVFSMVKGFTDSRGKFLDKNPFSHQPLADQIREGHFPAFMIHNTQEDINAGARGMLRAWAGAQPDTKFWGWKEVHMLDTAERVDILKWVADAMPDAKFILLRRDIAAVVESMKTKPTSWWFHAYGPPENYRTAIDQIDHAMSSFSDYLGDRGWDLNSDEILAEGFTKKMKSRIGVSISEEALSDVLNQVVR